jgi:hypothetical protein
MFNKYSNGSVGRYKTHAGQNLYTVVKRLRFQEAITSFEVQTDGARLEGEVPLIATFISKYITGMDRRARLDASFKTRYAVKYHFFDQILTPRGAQTSLIY